MEVGQQAVLFNLDRIMACQFRLKPQKYELKATSTLR